MKELEIQSTLQTLSNWKMVNTGIEKDFSFGTFAQALQFINQVGSLAEKMNHHPDINNSYNKVKLYLTTHDAGGLTQKDFDLAKAIDALP